jgi:transcriptional regulator with XRE-family HTH domain
MAINDFVLDAFNPTTLAKGIALRMRERRLELNLSQKGLATKAGVTLGSLKRFENSFEISMKHLLMIAVVLDATETFGKLFSTKQYQSIDEMLSATSPKKRQRGKRND